MSTSKKYARKQERRHNYYGNRPVIQHHTTKKLPAKLKMLLLNTNVVSSSLSSRFANTSFHCSYCPVPGRPSSVDDLFADGFMREERPHASFTDCVLEDFNDRLVNLLRQTNQGGCFFRAGACTGSHIERNRCLLKLRQGFMCKGKVGIQLCWVSKKAWGHLYLYASIRMCHNHLTDTCTNLYISCGLYGFVKAITHHNTCSSIYDYAYPIQSLMTAIMIIISQDDRCIVFPFLPMRQSFLHLN